MALFLIREALSVREPIYNPGTIIGRNSNIYPLSSVRGYVPAKSIYKNQNEIVDKR